MSKRLSNSLNLRMLASTLLVALLLSTTSSYLVDNRGSSDQDSTTISQISFREGARMLPCFVNVLGADSSGLYWNEGCSLDLGSKNSGYIGMRVLLETGFN